MPRQKRVQSEASIQAQSVRGLHHQSEADMQ